MFYRWHKTFRLETDSKQGICKFPWESEHSYYIQWEP